MFTIGIAQSFSNESVCIRERTWLPYCSDTKSDCSGTIGQPSYVTVIQDGGAREI